MLSTTYSELKKSLPQTKNMVAYIIESENRGVLGRDIIFHASKEHPTELEVRRMDWVYANSLLPYQRSRFPSIIMVPIRQNNPYW